MNTNVLLATLLLAAQTYCAFCNFGCLQPDYARQLVLQLDADSATDRVEAYNGLVEMGEESIPALLESPWANHKRLTLYAPRIIKEIGAEAAEPLMSALREGLNSPAPKDSDALLLTGDALIGLGAIGPEAAEAVPLILEALDSPGGLGMVACQTLEEIQPRSEEVKLALLESLDGADVLVVSYAAFALGSVAEPGDQEVIDNLITAMDNDEFGLHTMPFTYALYTMGWEQVEMFRIIEDCFTNVSSSCARSSALMALIRIGDSRSVALLRESILDENDILRHLALCELQRIGPSPQVVEILIKTLSDADPNMRVWAAYILGVFGPEARIALPELESLMDQGNSEGFDNEMLSAVEEAIILISTE